MVRRRRPCLAGAGPRDNREPGANPGLPRSGDRERPPSPRAARRARRGPALGVEPGKRWPVGVCRSRQPPESPKTCHRCADRRSAPFGTARDGRVRSGGPAARPAGSEPAPLGPARSPVVTPYALSIPAHRSARSQRRSALLTAAALCGALLAGCSSGPAAPSATSTAGGGATSAGATTSAAVVGRRRPDLRRPRRARPPPPALDAERLHHRLRPGRPTTSR